MFGYSYESTSFDDLFCFVVIFVGVCVSVRVSVRVSVSVGIIFIVDNSS